jgi:hypothetical protein
MHFYDYAYAGGLVMLLLIASTFFTKICSDIKVKALHQSNEIDEFIKYRSAKQLGDIDK